MSKIHDDFLKGGIFKELVKNLLQKSGYEIFPYGYETTFSVLKNRLSAIDVRNSPSVRRMKSAPDLVVYDKKRQDLMFVEVKMRSSLLQESSICTTFQAHASEDLPENCQIKVTK